jgi:hypothetical protein
VSHVSPITYITPQHNKHHTTLIPMPKTRKAAPTRLGTSPQWALSRIASLQSPPRRILSGLAASRAPKGTSASRGVNRGPDFLHVSSPGNRLGTAARGIAEVGSVSVLVCDWERAGLCQIVGAAGPTRVRCQFGGGCDCVLHHLCQTEWESKEETGSGEYSCSWFYNKLLCLKLPHSIETARSTDLYHMQTCAVAYLNKVPDHQQYPASRCAQMEGVCMFMRTASSLVESMNRANASVRERTAVNPINACILLLNLEGERFGKHRDLAHNHTEVLTPHGMKLITKAFKDVNPRKFEIYINPQGDRLSCCVNHIISPNIYTCWFHTVEEEGSLFGDCTCGVPRVDGIPCQHMMAVCKSKKIDGLNENNIMPLTYHTSLWRKQYPSGVSVTCVANI